MEGMNKMFLEILIKAFHPGKVFSESEINPRAKALRPWTPQAANKGRLHISRNWLDVTLAHSTATSSDHQFGPFKNEMRDSTRRATTNKHARSHGLPV